MQQHTQNIQKKLADNAGRDLRYEPKPEVSKEDNEKETHYANGQPKKQEGKTSNAWLSEGIDPSRMGKERL